MIIQKSNHNSNTINLSNQESYYLYSMLEFLHREYQGSDTVSPTEVDLAKFLYESLDNLIEWNQLEESLSVEQLTDEIDYINDSYNK
ncbi:hypothetical protein PQ478_09365 [Alkalihalophilus pseudofirmus]|uniref:hypothetical protein n=1 Tax=Alkalihalophilus pseudofirmus TaxID=79885 RepID=UPI00259B5073|nr:hypothetical protein [Alkalihalophilus pseudofirmus]WEG18676.1 hypothetical protein PQ478_09365 [Alkalihalophilus pseudofirmus]